MASRRWAKFAFSANNKSKVHIIATHWDVLNDPDADWRRQKEYLIKLFVGPEFFETKMMAYENIMPSAAPLYNLCRDYEFLSKEERCPLRKFAVNYDYDLPEDLDKIKAKTNIAAIMRIISDKLVHDYKKLMIEDIQKRLEEKQAKRDGVQQVSAQLNQIMKLALCERG